MPERRITNGQRAAICGLVLAGVGLQNACQIVGADSRTVLRYVGGDWRVRANLPVALHDMTRDQRSRYKKAQQALPRHVAFAEAMR